MGHWDLGVTTDCHSTSPIPLQPDQELGLSYKVKAWKRTSESKAPPDLKQVHPLGKVSLSSFSERQEAWYTER
jgi:hypothetical protein